MLKIMLMKGNLTKDNLSKIVLALLAIGVLIGTSSEAALARKRSPALDTLFGSTDPKVQRAIDKWGYMTIQEGNGGCHMYYTQNGKTRCVVGR